MTEAEALIEAVKEGDVARVTALVETAPALASARLLSGESPMMAALYRGHYHVIAALVDAGAEVDVFVAAATGRTGDLRRGLYYHAAGHPRGRYGRAPPPPPAPFLAPPPPPPLLPPPAPPLRAPRPTLAA